VDDIVGLFLGCAVFALGVRGVSGRPLPGWLRLYNGGGAATPEGHARAQRWGGAGLIVGGVVFVGGALHNLFLT